MGRAASDGHPNLNVFINCPYDKDYKPLLDAIAFAIHDCGFVARAALEEVDSGRTRLDKILSIIGQCDYGIHDISRTEAAAPHKWPRFNMPFECGLFFGAREFGGDRHRNKRLLVLDREPNRYRGTLSDIAGQDIGVHNDEPKQAIARVRTFLARAAGGHRIPGAEAIWKRYTLFRDQLPKLVAQIDMTTSEIDSLENFGDYLHVAIDWIQANERRAARR